MLEVTHAMTTLTMRIHIARSARRVTNTEEDTEAAMVSNTVMTSERKTNRGVGRFVDDHYWRLSVFCLSSRSSALKRSFSSFSVRINLSVSLSLTTALFLICFARSAYLCDIKYYILLTTTSSSILCCCMTSMIMNTPQCRQCLVVVDVGRTQRCYHHSFAVAAKRILQQLGQRTVAVRHKRLQTQTTLSFS
jgi:hypothetical protein